MKKGICVNCKTKLEGLYCHSCGEKVVTEKDFTIKKLLEQTVDVFTHLDSKVFATLKLLLFKPGGLSVFYIEGLRKPFMKPFQIFILINILFFLLLSNADVFRMPSSYFFTERSLWGYDINDIVLRKTIETNKTRNEIALLYDQKSASLSKTFVIAFIPLISLVFAFLFIRKKLQIGKHIVFSTHIFSFILLMMVLWTQLFNILPKIDLKPLYLNIIPSILVWSVYFGLAIKRFYNASWVYTIISTVISIAALFVIVESYRFAISLYSLMILH